METHVSQTGLAKRLSSQTDVVPQTSTSFGSPSSSTHAIITIDDEEPKNKKPKLGSWWDDVEAVNELSSVFKGLPKEKDDNDAESRLDSRFSATDLHENKKKDVDRSLSSSHRDNFIDLSEDSVGESTSTRSSNNGNGHVSLEELGVSVEDLKSMPWEAFDPTWEIRSETMDPWLGGYIKALRSPNR